jgi:hypothetical protein
VLAKWNHDKGQYEIVLTAEEMGVTLFSLNYTAYYAKDVDAAELERHFTAAINARYDEAAEKVACQFCSPIPTICLCKGKCQNKKCSCYVQTEKLITTGIDLGHLGGY